jgi:purine-binding chemotaxis protein CheW
VVAAEAMSIGLLMDSVHEVVSIPLTAVEPAPELVLSQIDSGYLQGIAKLDGGQRMVLLLNIDEILSRAQFQRLLELQPDGGPAATAEDGARPPAPRRESRRKLRLAE